MFETLVEGKTKIVTINERGTVFIFNKDAITAGDGLKKDTIPGKGELATRTTCNMFQLLQFYGIATHYIKTVDASTFEARRVKMIPIEVVVRRYAMGSYLKRNPTVEKGRKFEFVKVEMFAKDDEKHDPMIDFDFTGGGKISFYNPHKPMTDGYLYSEPLADHYSDISPRVAIKMELTAQKAFCIIEEAWRQFGGKLCDFKIEFGIDTDTGELLIADVIDSDSWRLLFGNEEKDKQAYRDGSKPLEKIMEDYAYVADLSDKIVSAAVEARCKP